MVIRYLILVIFSVEITFGINILSGFKPGILYQYEWSTRIQLTNREETRTVDEQDASAIVSAQLLHWDQESDTRILVMWVDNCVNVYCPQSKQGGSTSGQLKFFSIWHGSTVEQILSSSSQLPEKWDLLQSILFQLQFNLDAVKLRPAGMCDVQYSETNTITRRLWFCKSLEQVTLIGKAIDFKSNFTQTSHYYFDASSKIRQLTVQERYELSTSVFSHIHTVVVSQSKLTLIDHSDKSVSSQEQGVDFKAYLEILKKEQNLQLAADSIEEQFSAAILVKRSLISPATNEKCACLGGVKSLQRLLSSPKKSLETFVQLSNYLKSVDQSHLLTCLNSIHHDHKPLVEPLIKSIAIAGSATSQETVHRFLDSLTDNDSLRKSYFLMVSHNLWPKKVATVLLDQFKKSIATSKDLDEYTALAVAAVVRRTGTVQLQGHLLKILSDVLNDCKSSKCLEITLRALRNLAHSDTARYVKRFLCHDSELVVLEALESLRSVDTRHWTNETLHDLAMVYADLCPSGRSDPSCRTTAAEMLLKVEPNRRWAMDVGPLLLKPLLTRKKRDREVHTYSLAKILDLAAVNESYKEVITQSIQDVLHNDYSRLTHGGLSAAHTGTAADFTFARADYQLNMEFEGALPRRSNVDILVEDMDGSVSPLMSFALYARGMDSVIGENEGSLDDGASKKDEETTAGMRLSLFDQLQPPLTFFTGHSELMSAVWAANGEPMTAFEGQFLLSDLTGTVPLASGHTVLVDFSSALWWKLTGSVEISFWYRNAQTTISSETLAMIKGHVTVQEGDKGVLMDKSVFTADLKVDFETDIDFSQTPFRLCLQMNQHPVEIKYVDYQKKLDDDQSKKQIWRREVRRRLNGHCFVTEPKVMRQCNQLLKDLGKA